MKKKLSDIVFQRISPPDHKDQLSSNDLSNVLVRRLGLKRKESKAQHDLLLTELIRHRKDNIPLSIEQISQILAVSQSQTYEEIRKWRTLGLIEFVKIPAEQGFVKGYMLTGVTVNRLLDKVESSTKSFMRKTRRIAKDFDDLLMLEMTRSTRIPKTETQDGESDDEDNENPDEDQKEPEPSNEEEQKMTPKEDWPNNKEN